MTRRLTPEEERLWRLAMRGTDRLHNGPAAPEKAPPEAPKKSFKSKTRSVKGRPVAAVPPPPKPTPPPALHHLDRRSQQKVRRGKVVVDGKIDLHGMSQTEAHNALIRYVLSAADHGKRVVLVVTGKGRKGTAGHFWEEDRPDFTFEGRGEGILKAQVPLWLNQSPLRERIFSVQQAHPRHGGSGALYVFIKRT